MSIKIRYRRKITVTGADAQAVQPLSAVGLRSSPFANNGPFIRVIDLSCKSTGRLNMLGRSLRNLALAENLILVCVKHDVVNTRLGVHEAIPVLDTLEGVVDGDDSVGAAIANIAPSVVVKLLQVVQVDIWPERLVDKLDGGNDVRIARVALRQARNGIECLLYGVALLPVDRCFAATVVEAILGAGS